jgi:microsomal dipeptidase-like Zn-dependent dipeptidase
LQVVKSYRELDDLIKQGENAPIAVIHAIEGGHTLEGALVDERRSHADAEAIEAEILANLETFRQRGIAYITLAHFYPNRIAHPTYPYPEEIAQSVRDDRQKWVWRDLTCGLTEFGERVVREMFEKGMLIDVSHCTPPARRRIYQIADSDFPDRKGVVMATHVGAYAINPRAYNLEDWEIEWLARHGGVMGVIFMNYWLMPKATDFGLHYISRTIEHIVNVGGIDVPALGSDFDGFSDPPDDLIDASMYPRLTQRLVSEFKSKLERKYSSEDIWKILGGNVLNMLKRGWRGG